MKKKIFIGIGAFLLISIIALASIPFFFKGKIQEMVLKTINDNLGKLGELPFGKLDDELAMDEGFRKEVAMNLAVFYYSFGKNMAETQKLFNKYYKYPDAKKVWTAFSKSLLYIKKDNDF